jgi:hypothetical protein
MPSSAGGRGSSTIRNSGDKAGLYGSGCGSSLETLWYSTSPRPDWIWGADYDNDPNAQSIACVSATHWTGSTRHKQYRSQHTVTYGGVTVEVDSDCAFGPMYANQNRDKNQC